MADGFMRMLASRLHILKENIVVSCSLLNGSLLSSLSTSVPSATSPLLPLPQLLVPAIPTLRFQAVTFVDSTRNGICPPVVKAGCSSLKSLSGSAPFSSVAVPQVRCSCWQPPCTDSAPFCPCDCILLGPIILEWHLQDERVVPVSDFWCMISNELFFILGSVSSVWSSISSYGHLEAGRCRTIDWYSS